MTSLCAADRRLRESFYENFENLSHFITFSQLSRRTNRKKIRTRRLVEIHSKATICDALCLYLSIWTKVARVFQFKNLSAIDLDFLADILAD